MKIKEDAESVLESFRNVFKNYNAKRINRLLEENKDQLSSSFVFELFVSAITLKNTEILESLLQNPILKDKDIINGQINIFHYACSVTDSRYAVLIAKYRPKLIDSVDGKGYTGIVMACYAENADHIRQIINLKPELINEKAGEFKNALELSIASKKYKAAKVLLEYKELNTNIKTPKGLSFLLCLLNYEDVNAELIKLVLDHPNTKVSSEDTRTLFAFADNDENHEKLKVLYKHPKIDINFTFVDKGGDNKNQKYNFIDYLLEEEKFDLAIDLIESREDLEFNLVEGQTPLTKASYASNLPLVKALLKHPNADVNAVGQGGATALFYAYFSAIEKEKSETYRKGYHITTDKQMTLFSICKHKDINFALSYKKIKEFTNLNNDGCVSSLCTLAFNKFDLTYLYDDIKKYVKRKKNLKSRPEQIKESFISLTTTVEEQKKTANEFNYLLQKFTEKKCNYEQFNNLMELLKNEYIQKNYLFEEFEDHCPDIKINIDIQKRTENAKKALEIVENTFAYSDIEPPKTLLDKMKYGLAAVKYYIEEGDLQTVRYMHLDDMLHYILNDIKAFFKIENFVKDNNNNQQLAKQKPDSLKIIFANKKLLNLLLEEEQVTEEFIEVIATLAKILPAEASSQSDSFQKAFFLLESNILDINHFKNLSYSPSKKKKNSKKKQLMKQTVNKDIDVINELFITEYVKQIDIKKLGSNIKEIANIGARLIEYGKQDNAINLQNQNIAHIAYCFREKNYKDLGLLLFQKKFWQLMHQDFTKIQNIFKKQSIKDLIKEDGFVDLVENLAKLDASLFNKLFSDNFFDKNNINEINQDVMNLINIDPKHREIFIDFSKKFPEYNQKELMYIVNNTDIVKLQKISNSHYANAKMLENLGDAENDIIELVCQSKQLSKWMVDDEMIYMDIQDLFNDYNKKQQNTIKNYFKQKIAYEFLGFNFVKNILAEHNLTKAINILSNKYLINLVRSQKIDVSSILELLDDYKIDSITNMIDQNLDLIISNNSYSFKDLINKLGNKSAFQKIAQFTENLATYYKKHEKEDVKCKDLDLFEVFTDNNIVKLLNSKEVSLKQLLKMNKEGRECFAKSLDDYTNESLTIEQAAASSLKILNQSKNIANKVQEKITKLFINIINNEEYSIDSAVQQISKFINIKKHYHSLEVKSLVNFWSDFIGHNQTNEEKTSDGCDSNQSDQNMQSWLLNDEMIESSAQNVVYLGKNQYAMLAKDISFEHQEVYEQSLQKGFAATAIGANGIKKFGNFYELKINHSARLCNEKVYINSDGKKLIIFEKEVSHEKASNAIRCNKNIPIENVPSKTADQMAEDSGNILSDYASYDISGASNSYEGEEAHLSGESE